MRRKTDKSMCFKPLPRLIDELNRHLKGWANYFSYGYPSMAYRALNWFVLQRLSLHLKRRSQRRIVRRKGLVCMRICTRWDWCNCKTCECFPYSSTLPVQSLRAVLKELLNHKEPEEHEEY